MKNVYTGKAGPDAATDHGWLLGHFKPEDDLRHSTEVEIKWGVHRKGDRRAEWTTDDKRTALLVLISGRFVLEFPDGDVELAEQGDYVLWHQVDHSWRAEEESTVMTVRWPSVPGHKIVTADGREPEPRSPDPR
ncbi:signal peptidase I [Actinomadura kijaniata]|uniref:signal peptidase I n=1 Tax=Actinomadura kijaniata TaxID=46161 RepID=UPI003F1DE712